MKLNSEQSVAWFNHRVYPMFAVALLHFLLGGVLVIAFGVAGPDSGLPLFIISIAVALFTTLNVWGTLDDMKRLTEDMSDELKSTRFGQGFSGFSIFGVIMTLLVLAIPVAHGLLFL